MDIREYLIDKVKERYVADDIVENAGISDARERYSRVLADFRVNFSDMTSEYNDYSSYWKKRDNEVTYLRYYYNKGVTNYTDCVTVHKNNREWAALFNVFKVDHLYYTVMPVFVEPRVPPPADTEMKVDGAEEDGAEVDEEEEDGAEEDDQGMQVDIEEEPSQQSLLGPIQQLLYGPAEEHAHQS